MDQNKYELLILRKTRSTLQKWVGTLLLICTLYVFLIYKGFIGLFELSDSLKETSIFVIFFVVILMAFSHILIEEDNNIVEKQFRMQITISVIILSLIVFISGGLLDSPFAGAITFFVGAFISFQSDDTVRQNLKQFNLFLITFSVLLLVLPYLYFHFRYGSACFFSWNSNSLVFYERIAFTVLLLIITGRAAAKINRELNSLQSEEKDAK